MCEFKEEEEEEEEGEEEGEEVDVAVAVAVAPTSGRTPLASLALQADRAVARAASARGVRVPGRPVKSSMVALSRRSLLAKDGSKTLGRGLGF